MTVTARSLSGVALALAGVLVALSGCHTTAGFGEDVSNTGDAIERSAEKNAPK